MAESRVLVVEDDQALRMVIAEALGEDGYAVDTAPDAEVALKLAGRLPPDLVLLGLLLPFMSGEDVSAAMRLLPGLAATPIILISALREAEEVGARIGASAALRKPFDLFELTERVHGILR
jgi:DNA-binding response OmpR family regulator